MEKSSDLEKIAENIIRKAISRVSPEALIRNSVRRDGGGLLVGGSRYDLSLVRNIHVIAFGKAAAGMASALGKVMGKRIKGGIVTGRPGPEAALPDVEYIDASHPLPDEKSVKAAAKVLEFAKKSADGDLVFVLVSGGGSSLLCLPAAGISLGEKKDFTAKLLRTGASIWELNAVRKHLSAIKGGRLARALYPAAVVNLVISDVSGDDLETIASGPTHWDSTTFADAAAVLRKYGLWDAAPVSIRKVMESGLRGEIAETLRADDPLFQRVSTHIIGRNRTALDAAAEEAESAGFTAVVFKPADRGEARSAGKAYAGLLLSLADSIKASEGATAAIWGGELTVTVRGSGRGGRNMECMLAALAEMMERQPDASWDWLMASAGTDGIDGPTDAAGAWIGPRTIETVRRLSLDPRTFLEDSDSYGFFKRAGGLIFTGATGTNVMDIRLFLLKRR